VLLAELEHFVEVLCHGLRDLRIAFLWTFFQGP